MIKITARTTTPNLKIKKSMAKLFQSFVYSILPPKEHEGYRSEKGKIFKSTNFRIAYFNECFHIDFVALNKEYEKEIALKILKEGLRLGEVHIPETRVESVERRVGGGKMIVRGRTCVAIKDGKRKTFIAPANERHVKILTNHSIEKYETLLGEKYEDELTIKTLRQMATPRYYYYEKMPYKAWLAEYEIRGSEKMLNLLLDTGLGGCSMKNLGFLELVEADNG